MPEELSSNSNASPLSMITRGQHFGTMLIVSGVTFFNVIGEMIQS